MSRKPKPLKATRHFQSMRSRPDRAIIDEEWIRKAIESPEHENIQNDGRIRRWIKVEAMDGRYLRVVLLPDGEKVHNALFDRRFKP